MKKLLLFLIAISAIVIADEPEGLSAQDDVSADTAARDSVIAAPDTQADGVATSADIARESPRLLTPQATARWDKAYENQVKYGTILYGSQYIDPAGIVAVGGVIPGGSSFFTHDTPSGVLHAIVQVGALIIFPIIHANLSDATAKETADASKIELENAVNAGNPNYNPKAVPKIYDRKSAKGVCIVVMVAIPAISKFIDMATGYRVAVEHNKNMETKTGGLK